MHTPLCLLRIAPEKQEQFINPVDVKVPDDLIMEADIILCSLWERCTLIKDKFYDISVVDFLYLGPFLK